MTSAAVHRIVSDEWDGVLSREQVIEQPSEYDVRRLIERMDASRYTMLVLEGTAPSHMVIGGGGGRYVMYACRDGERFEELASLASTGAPRVTVRAGGQDGDYPADRVVGLDQVLAAAVVYFRSGELDPSQKWFARP